MSKEPEALMRGLATACLDFQEMRPGLRARWRPRLLAAPVPRLWPLRQTRRYRQAVQSGPWELPLLRMQRGSGLPARESRATETKAEARQDAELPTHRHFLRAEGRSRRLSCR